MFELAVCAYLLLALHTFDERFYYILLLLSFLSAFYSLLPLILDILQSRFEERLCAISGLTLSSNLSELITEYTTCGIQNVHYV